MEAMMKPKAESESETAVNFDNDNDKKKKGMMMTVAPGGGKRCCQAEKCTAELSDAKAYHRRHRVCEHHAKAQVVIVSGIRQRFCQQCSRFHEVGEFDETKRSCRRRLAGHNERRRKGSLVYDHHHHQSQQGEGSNSSRTTSSDQVEDNNNNNNIDKGRRIQITLQPLTNKHFQIR